MLGAMLKRTIADVINTFEPRVNIIDINTVVNPDEESIDISIEFTILNTTAPITPQVATTTINQGQVNQLASATARAFVLESDVSGNQERIQRLNRAARIS